MFTGFFGRFTHNIDEKGRITFPVAFRESLGDHPFILNGFDGNLLVMDEARFQKLSDMLNNLNLANAEARQTRRNVFSSATRIEFDKVGRFIIPQDLRESAKLTNSALVFGIGSMIEIWSPETHKKNETEGEGRKSAAALLSNFDLTIN